MIHDPNDCAFCQVYEQALAVRVARLADRWEQLAPFLDTVGEQHYRRLSGELRDTLTGKEDHR